MSRSQRSRFPRHGTMGPLQWALATGTALWVSLMPCCSSAPAGTPEDGIQNSHLSVGSAQYPDDDAVILRWEQEWTIERDGAVRQRDHKWVKLLHMRPVRELADPRIDFCDGQDEVTIHTARTILPSGEMLPVPAYSINVTADADVAGWPEYAAWKQYVVSFSGVQPGATLELDYEIRTRAGAVGWVSADLRLDDDHPIVERVVRVTVPKGTPLLQRLERGGADVEAPLPTSAADQETYTWFVRSTRGSAAEAQSSPWYKRCPRLRWSTAGSAERWTEAILESVRGASRVDEEVKWFVDLAIDDERDQRERVVKIADKIRDRLNHVSSAKAHRGLRCRAAGEVVRANYGHPLETAAVCLASLGAVNIDAEVRVAVDNEMWDADVPTDAAFAGVVIVSRAGDGTMFVHPEHGVVENPGQWGGYRLLGIDDGGRLSETKIHARGDEDGSEMHVAGKIVVGDDGSAEGELRVRLTGAFYDPQNLDSAAKQTEFVEGLIDRLLDGVTAAGHSISVLSADSLHMVVTVSAKEKLPSEGDRFVLQLGDGPAFVHDFPLPLERSCRFTDVELDGSFQETLDLVLEIPDAWSAPIVPASVPAVTGPWGTIRQDVAINGKTIVVQRQISVEGESISPDDFATLREGINELRADGSLTFLLGA